MSRQVVVCALTAPEAAIAICALRRWSAGYARYDAEQRARSVPVPGSWLTGGLGMRWEQVQVTRCL